MNTAMPDANTSTDDTLTAWAAALIDAGWARQSIEKPPAHLAGIRILTDPDGHVQALAEAHHTGDIVVELRSTALRDDNRLVWYVIAGWLDAPVVAAAARAAGDEATGQAAGDLLINGGWRLQRYEAFTTTFSEYQWASGDDACWAVFTTPDSDPDGEGGDGGWTLAHPRPDGNRQTITASARTPAALIAALALAG
ncbi:hypothetical protein [Catenulispora rubra]|uniref:hypothetical protein n=1 Tax=Catenulispora rubra TaxID=280293 RepID=UPI00189286E0|nr:hypothetical protein [Catenulispora rubra]